LRTLEEWWFFIKINNKELSIKNKKINALINKIEEIINNSKVPEDPIHSKNTLTWVYRLEKDVDIPLIISALGHDIERAIEDLKVKRADYETYNEFKKAHALNSAKILKKIMIKNKIDNDIINETYYLVKSHEFGGNKKAEILKNADTLSFFDTNLHFYYQRNSLDDTKKRILWGYRKLPIELRKLVKQMNYPDKKLKRLVINLIANE